MAPARKDKSGKLLEKPGSLTAKFAKIHRTARADIAERPAQAHGLATGPREASAGLALGVAAAPAPLDKDQRIIIMEADAAAAGKIADEFEARTASADPVEAARALDGMIEAKNTRDDLKENVALLRDKDVFKPLDAGTIQHLNELADIINARIKSAALVSATLAILAETLRSAAMVGQILDERG